MSNEIADVLEAIETLAQRGEKMALATIVAVRGSTYRRPGARLLVPQTGELIGNISGRCEGGARGAGRLVHPDGRQEKPRGTRAADKAAAKAARDALAKEHSIKQDIAVGDGVVTAFVEVLEPSPRLLVCGAGHDAIPVVRFAAQLGWRPVVIDDRDRFLTHERFDEAAEFIPLDKPPEAAGRAGVDRRTFVLVMSHNYLRDRDYIRSFLGTEVVYIGSLGPRKRLDSPLADLPKEGVETSEEA